MTDVTMEGVAKAVNRWMGYQKLCERDSLFCESYLGHPIAEYLINKFSGKQLSREADHPNLKNDKRGRPCQIDYVVKGRNSGKIILAIECKWVSEKSFNKQGVFDDLLRLECLSGVDVGNAKKYFLIAGEKNSFKSKFQLAKIKPKNEKQANFAKQFFYFSKKKLNVNLKRSSTLSSFVKRFHEEYGIEVPTSINTKLVAYRTADNICVFIWSVSRVRNRGTFTPG